MMAYNKNVFGLGLAGTGLVLSLFAGTTASAGPEHDKKVKGDPPACCAHEAKACAASAKAKACDGKKGKSKKIENPHHTGKHMGKHTGEHMGEHMGEHVGTTQSQGTRFRVVKRGASAGDRRGHERALAEGGMTGHIVIVSPDGETHEFTFGGKGKAHSQGKAHKGKGHTGHADKVHKGEGHTGKGHTGEGHTGKARSGKGHKKGAKSGCKDGADHGKSGRHNRHGSMGLDAGGGATWADMGDDAFVIGMVPDASFGGFAPEAAGGFVSAGDVVSALQVDGSFFPTDASVSFFEVANDDTISIVIKNGKVTAKINGKKVPANRIKHTDDGIKILDEDGEVVATVPAFGKVDSAGRSGRAFQIGQPGADATVMVRPMVRPGAESMPEPPRVMLGIQMQPVDEEAAHEFDLKEGEGIQISGVIKGLPAQHAGIRENDIIIKIGGVGSATQEGLRRVLREKKPGDVLAFKVIRKGKVKEVVVKLEPFDAEKLGMVMLDAGPGGSPGGSLRGVLRFEDGDASQYGPGEIEALVKRFKGKMGDMDFDEGEMEIAIEAFEEAMEKMADQFGEGTRGLRLFGGEGGNWRVIHGDEPGEVFTIPAPSWRERDGRGVRKELDVLKQQLDEVQRQRDELNAELAEIKELLKKIAGDRD